jgi:pimeloyl-ACP methyl ester carboxylesterase
MSVNLDTPLRGPRRRDLLKTALWPWEARGLPRAIREVTPRVENQPPVMVIPGLYASDRTLRPLRRYLQNAGYHAQGWGMGRNLAGREHPSTQADLAPSWDFAPARTQENGEANVPALADRLGAHVRATSERLDQPLSLVGWSLGGYLAREAARDLPDHVNAVITLGSPLIGGPKYTLLNKRFARRGVDVDWIDAQTRARHDKPLRCAVTSIYSKTDAVVHWSAALDRWTPGARHFEVGCSHAALGFHPPALAIIKAELDRLYV